MKQFFAGFIILTLWLFVYSQQINLDEFINKSEKSIVNCYEKNLQFVKYSDRVFEYGNYNQIDSEIKKYEVGN